MIDEARMLADSRLAEDTDATDWELRMCAHVRDLLAERKVLQRHMEEWKLRCDRLVAQGEPKNLEGG